MENPQENLPFNNIRLPAHYSCSSGNLKAPILPVIANVYNNVPDPRSWVANARSHMHPRSQVPSCRSIFPPMSQSPHASFSSLIATINNERLGCTLRVLASHPSIHISHLTPHTSHLTPHNTHLTPHTSRLTPPASHLTPPTKQEELQPASKKLQPARKKL